MRCSPENISKVLKSSYWKGLSGIEMAVFTRWFLDHEDFEVSPATIAKVLYFPVDSVKTALRALTDKRVLVREGSNHTRYSYRLHESMLDPSLLERETKELKHNKRERKKTPIEVHVFRALHEQNLFGQELLLDLIAKPAMLNKNVVSRTLTSLVKLGFISVTGTNIMGTRTFATTDKVKDKDLNTILQEIENEAKHGLQ